MRGKDCQIQSGSQRDLWISQRRVRSGDVVEGGRSRHQPGTLGAADCRVLDLPTTDEPFAAVIFCTADRQKVDKRTRSKWSRALRYAAEYKTTAEPLGRVRSAQGRHQQMCRAVYPLPRATERKVNVQPAGIGALNGSWVALWGLRRYTGTFHGSRSILNGSAVKARRNVS